MKLVVGTESTWSLRAWICSQIAELDPELEVVNLSNQDYKSEILQYSEVGLVPILNIENTSIHDSLAIIEYFNESCEGKLYPSETIERAKARSLCAEMHSGFSALRTNFPFTLKSVQPASNFDENIQQELQRVESIFTKAKLPFMFDSAGAVDSFYAILAYRLKTYGIELPGKAGEYQQSLLQWPTLQQAIRLAKEWSTNV